MNRISSFQIAMLILIGASNALAHAFPDRTTPAQASVVSEAPSNIVVHFDNAFDPSATKVRVLNQNGDVVSDASTPSGDHRTLTTALKPLAPGQYFVKWSALSQDGDRTMGAFSFTFKPEPH
jgi:methionine-rich copper-binding protein CopC